MSLKSWQEVLQSLPVQTKAHYVLGFAFSRHGQVLLIRKERPEWQWHRLNGLGGKIERGESDVDAMRREFREECGLDIEDWTLRGHCIGRNFEISVFSTILSEEHEPKTTTDEEVMFRYWTGPMDPDVLPHVEAMVHCCNMRIGANSAVPIFVFYY